MTPSWADTGGALGRLELDQDQDEARAVIASGSHVYVCGAPGTGKTTVALAAMRDASASPQSAGRCSWSPGLFLTADRRRAATVETRLGPLIPGSGARLRADGSHRLVRSLNSYAYLILGLWLVERESPLGRPHLLSGAEEDAWLTSFVSQDGSAETMGVSGSLLNSESVRMEVRNVMARAGQSGLLPDDLDFLAGEFDTPVWRLASAAYREFVGDEKAFSVETAHFDSARLPRIAADTLHRWEESANALGVHATMPLPSRVIVDDVQDLPYAALPLLDEMARLGSQVVVVGNRNEATAQFRGGVPDLGEQIISQLQGTTCVLSVPHRGTSRVVAATAEVERWLGGGRLAASVTGSSPEGEAEGTAATEVPAPPCGLGTARTASVIAHRVSTRSQMAERVSAILRERHLHGELAWQDMAVVVRHSRALEGLQRSLSRNGVPVQSGERPVVLSRIPIVRALLTLLAASDNQTVEERNREALELVVSPLVAADSLAVFRALRDFRAERGSALGLGMADLLDAIAAGTYRPRSGPDMHSPAAEAAQSLDRAADLWAHRRKARTMDPRLGVWSLWDRADLAKTLRSRSRERSAAGRVAAEQLDAMLALLRRADLWSQERAFVRGQSADAYHFARETLEQTVATDPLVPRGLAESGVWVVTPAQAAGRQWDCVVVADLEEGSWPAPMVASSADAMLTEAIRDARARGWRDQERIEPFLPDRGAFRHFDRASMRGERRRDEASLFLVAISRSRGDVHLVAVDNEESAPSTFLVALIEAGLAEVEGIDQEHPLSDRFLTMTALVSGLRRQLVAAGSLPDTRREAARLLALLSSLGIRDADPDLWGAKGALSTDSPVLAQGPLRLGPASIQSGRDCPLRWFLSDVGGRRQELHEEAQVLDGAVVGQIIHTLAEENPSAGPEQMRAALAKLWDRLALPKQTYWERRAFDEVSEMVAKMGAHFASFRGQVLTERAISFDAGEIRVSGRVDRIEVDDSGRARVVDVKSGKGDVGAKAEENAQLAAYQIGVTELGYESAGAALLVLRDRTALRTQDPLQGEGLVAARQSIADLAPSLGGARFAATPQTGNCRTCPFRHVCPAQTDSARSSE